MNTVIKAHGLDLTNSMPFLGTSDGIPFLFGTNFRPSLEPHIKKWIHTF